MNVANPYSLMASLLRSDDRRVRFKAVTKAGELEGIDSDEKSQLCKVLVQTLETDECPDVRGSAAWSVFKLGNSDDIDILVSALESERNFYTKTQIVHSLGEWLVSARIGKYDVIKITQALIDSYKREKDPRLKGWILSQLYNANCCPEIDGLRETLIHNNFNIEALQAGTRTEQDALIDYITGGDKTKSHREILMKKLESADPNEKLEALDLLYYSKDEADIPCLTKVLKDSSTDIRCFAASLLCSFNNPSVVNDIIDAYRIENDSNTRRVMLLKVTEVVTNNKDVAIDNLGQLADLIFDYIECLDPMAETLFFDIKHSERNDLKELLRERGINTDSKWDDRFILE